jgi:DNA-binding NarL/FixJ family response regulator
MIRVMLVDDHVLLRQGTRALLAAAADEVLTLVADGASNGAIGRQLHVKEATIEQSRAPGP